jgi:hypothetical protein
MLYVIRSQPHHSPTLATPNSLPSTNLPPFFARSPAHLLHHLRGWNSMIRQSPTRPIAIPCAHRQPSPLDPTSPRVPVAYPTPAAPPHCYPLHLQHSANNTNNATADLFTNVHQANTVVDPITGQVQEYRHLLQGPDVATWTKSFANKLGRLS